MNLDFYRLIEAALSGSVIMLVLFLGIIIFVLILSLILIISYVKALKKAGVSAVNVLWVFLPIPLIASIILALKLDPVKKFDKGSGYLVGLILLPIIFVPLLAFSDKKESSSTSSVDNAFDANSVINNNVQTDFQNIVETNANTVENVSIVAETSESSSDIQNSVEESSNIVETISNPLVSETIPDVNTDVVPESISAFEPEVSNSTIIEPQVVAEEKIELQEPIIQEEVNNETTNAFNSAPIITENNMVVENETVEPINTTSNIETSQVDVLQDLNKEASTAKVCKNCGAQMPNIVSICPNCGTDNE